jgi:glycerate kinase
MRVLIAFDKYKDSLAAVDACRLTVDTLGAAHPDWTLDAAPLTDGGDGFAAILTAAAGGKRIGVSVAGPHGEPRTAQIGLIPWGLIPAAARERLALPLLQETDIIAVVEMAACSGLALVPPDRRDPWRTTSYGTGQALAAGFAHGARALVLGVGGSATHDLGLGALAAIGLHGRDAAKTEVFPPVPDSWARIAHFAGHVPAAFPPLRLACDVSSPLLGPRGAAATFAPQKGLRPAELPRLETATARMASLLVAHGVQPPCLATLPGAGAAGGIAFGLMAAARAQLVPGCALVHDWLDLDARIAAADLVITGEGRFDSTSLSGKGPGSLALAAAAAGKRVLILAGSVGELPGEALPAGVTAHAISPADLPLAEALARAPELLAAAVARFAAL